MSIFSMLLFFACYKILDCFRGEANEFAVFNGFDVALLFQRVKCSHADLQLYGSFFPGEHDCAGFFHNEVFEPLRAVKQNFRRLGLTRGMAVPW